MKMIFKISFVAFALFYFISCDNTENLIEQKPPTTSSEKIPIPDILHNFDYDSKGLVIFKDASGKSIPMIEKIPTAEIENFLDCVKGTENGLSFDFNNSEINGTLFCGFIQENKMKYPQPIFFKKSVQIENGKAEFDIKNTLKGKYDIAEWEENGFAQMGYRVILANGDFLHDGKFLFEVNEKGGFDVVLSIIEGPFINILTPNSTVISFRTNKPSICSIKVNNKIFKDISETNFHEIPIVGLTPNEKYDYEIIYGKHSFKSYFKTAPEIGSNLPFKFAFASDSRMGPGGGERSVFGVNAYIMKKISALASNNDVAFWQFTGDMVSGYAINQAEIKLQYFNWKRAIDAFSSSYPIYVGMGNHEVLMNSFGDKNNNYDDYFSVDKFPYETKSSEKTFADEFVNFSSSLISEDGNKYDPNPNKNDFPSYNENVYSYIYGNTAMIVLNSNYWYSPSRRKIAQTGGNLHGYIMDNQLDWLKNEVASLDENKLLKHIFVTFHTPAFPNGGHANDDMWYAGDNTFRPYIAGNPVDKGIIERRDEILKVLLESDKVVAILTGDEHNYSRLRLDKNTKIYPENWDKEKLFFNRTLWHICNGSAGAPYYGQEILPWSNSVEKFSTQYALCFFEIDGNNVNLTVQDPDTYEIIEKVKLK